MSQRLPTVAVINTSEDIIDMLRIAFEQAGFVVVSAFTTEVRDGRVDLAAFMKMHQPDVLVYDIAPPYEVNWRLFCHLHATAEVREVPLMLTTTNVRYVQPLVGDQAVHEIVGKPYDLNALIDRVRGLVSG